MCKQTKQTRQTSSRHPSAKLPQSLAAVHRPSLAGISIWRSPPFLPCFPSSYLPYWPRGDQEDRCGWEDPFIAHRGGSSQSPCFGNATGAFFGSSMTWSCFSSILSLYAMAWRKVSSKHFPQSRRRDTRGSCWCLGHCITRSHMTRFDPIGFDKSRPRSRVKRPRDRNIGF